MEIFKTIPGYPNYQISDNGRIWNVKTQKYLKPSKKPNGYFQVNLVAINGKRKKEYVHRLIAITYLPNPNNYPEVNHIDRNRGNNVLSNIEWCNRSQNMRNVKTNHIISVYGLDGSYLATYGSIVECAEALNGSVQGIYSYLYGKTNQPYLNRYYLED